MADRSLKVTIGGDVGPLDAALRKGANSVNVFVNQVSTGSLAAGAALGGIAASAVSAAGGLVASAAKGAAGFAAWGVQLAAEAEQAEIAFGVMLGSTEEAKTLLGELSDFAASTPFEIPGLRDAAKSLLAFGTPAQEIVPTLRALGDVASGLNIPLGELSEIYGKARVSGKLMSEDINQLSGRGIPIIQELAKQFGVADGEVKKLVEGGQVNFSHLEQAMISLTETGGQFSGMMEKQSQSVLGQWSTLSDGIASVATGIGEVILEEFGFSDLIGQGGALLAWFTESMMPGVRTVFRAIGQSVLYVTNAIRSLGADVLELSADFTPAIEAARLMGQVVLQVWAGVQSLAGDTEGAMKTAMQVAQLEGMSAGAISDAMKQQADELRRPIQETWKEMLDGIAAEAPKKATEQKSLSQVVKERPPTVADASKLATTPPPPTLPDKPTASTLSSGPGGLDVGGREAFAAIQARERGVDRQTDLAKQQLGELKAIAKAVAAKPQAGGQGPALASFL